MSTDDNKNLIKQIREHHPTPWTIRDDERYEGGPPVYVVEDADGEVVMDDQTYYPAAPHRSVAELLVILLNEVE